MITPQRIVDILEERFEEIVFQQQDLPADAHVQEELEARKKEVALLLLRIDTDVS